MKTIIAGGRDYTHFDYRDLDRLARMTITEVVTGKCKGADKEGENWAKDHDIPIKEFPADWDKHGKAAGPIRNRQMAEYADAVVLFPGGRGTNSMAKEAHKAGIRIFDLR